MRLKICSGNYMKAAFKEKLWIPVFLAVGFLMAFPVAELIKLQDWSLAGYTREQIQILYVNLWQDGLFYTGSAVVACAAFMNAFSSFYYLYSSRKVDLYHSLPTGRGKMFLERVSSGMLLYLAPYLVMEFAAVCMGAMWGFFSLSLMKAALEMFLAHLLLYLLWYFTTVLAVTVTGNLLMGSLVFLGLALWGPMLSYLLTWYASSFFETYSFYYYNSCSLWSFLNYGSPMYLGLELIELYGREGFLPVLSSVIVATVLLGAASFVAYKRRPLESTGKALVFPWMEIFLQILSIPPIALGLGLIFHSMPVKGDGTPWWIFGMALGLILGHGIWQVICRMDFRAFFSRRRWLLAELLLTAAFAAVFPTDLFGYDTWLPDSRKLEKVQLYSDAMDLGTSNYVSFDDHGNYLVSTDASSDTAGFAVNEEIYQALESIVENQPETTGASDGSINVNYRLKSGKNVARSYSLNAAQAQTLYTACVRSGDFVEENYSFLEIEGRYLGNVSGIFYDGTMHSLFQNEAKDRSELLQALQEDLLEASPEDLMQAPCVQLNFVFNGMPVTEAADNMVPLGHPTASCYASVNVYPGFSRTLDILSQTGYPISMEEVGDFEYVTVTYYGKTDEESGLREMEQIRYEDEEELEELADCLIPFATIWSREAEMETSVKVKITDVSEMTYMWFTEGNIPDFIRSDGEKYGSIKTTEADEEELIEIIE
ncbi:MAG: DUF6449 domain-containing protein [Clostridiales bacterium]|nr:DUF6449 domain-containing protein [Clostridiales bacterium]